MYSVLNKFSERRYFYITKDITSCAFCLFLTFSSPQEHGCPRHLRAIFYDLDTFIWLLLCLLLIYVVLLQISSLFFFELFLVTSAVADTRGSRDTSYVTVLSP